MLVLLYISLFQTWGGFYNYTGCLSLSLLHSPVLRVIRPSILVRLWLFLRRSCAATAAAFIQGKPRSELHGCCNVITSYYLGHSTTIQLRKSFTFCHLFHVGEGCCLFWLLSVTYVLVDRCFAEFGLILDIGGLSSASSTILYLKVCSKGFV